jgi:hypothetical protein
MKKSTKSPIKKPVLKKAQMGKSVKPTADSTDYFKKRMDEDYESAARTMNYPKENAQAFKRAKQSTDSYFRQKDKGKPGYDANGYPLNKFKPKSPSQQISEGMKTKKKNGGIIKAKNNKK